MGRPGYIEDARTFWELVERRSAASPETPVLLDSNDRRVTAAELKERAERAAAGFAALGVGAGTPVMWQLPTRIESVITSLALSRLGAVQSPVLHLYRDKELAFCLQQSGARLYLGPGTWRGHDYSAMAARVGESLGVDLEVVDVFTALPDGDPSVLPPPPVAADPAPVRWIYSTSGTTSEPKGVLHTDETLIAGGLGLALAVDMGADDVGSMAFPYAHIAGPDYLVMMLVCGCPAVLLEAFVIDEAVAAFRRHGVTTGGGGPAFYQMFINEQRKNPTEPLIPTLRFLGGGGAPKPPEMFYEVQREMRCRGTVHGYGMTEVPMISQGSPHDTDEQLANTDGTPVHGAEVRIVGEDGSLAPTGVDGEIRVRGPMVCKGYTKPELTAEAFDQDGFFRTGDVGHVRADGHLRLTGRLKDIIIRKGENIGAKEIEDLLYQHPKVGDVAVIGLPDRDRGERVCAVVERPPGGETLTFEEMRQALRDGGLLTIKIPEQLEVVDALPRNDTLRKVLKYKLREEYARKPWPA